MRYLVIALMIVLLPLRGWTADSMATQMATSMGSAIAIKSVAAGAHGITAAASFDHQNQAFEASHSLPDCHMQATGQSDTDQAATSGTCQACQACHTVALSPSLLELTASRTSPQLRPHHAAAFTSAAAALGQKPPIS